MAQSRIAHKEPIIGSRDPPCRETGMRGFGFYLWWAFCLNMQTHENEYRKGVRHGVAVMILFVVTPLLMAGTDIQYYPNWIKVLISAAIWLPTIFWLSAKNNKN